ncbi:hypothetical protein FKW77_000688 [Venturia effusa]|uniref:Uncharacterized protein n=1 Tax=Venturia effusa TaxID=50376 RepID=A0A517LAA2_9PEZI|nr:hypothetical protein FKW77_000688 [Venturia effusa]
MDNIENTTSMGDLIASLGFDPFLVLSQDLTFSEYVDFDPSFTTSATAQHDSAMLAEAGDQSDWSTFYNSQLFAPSTAIALAPVGTEYDDKSDPDNRAQALIHPPKVNQQRQPYTFYNRLHNVADEY